MERVGQNGGVSESRALPAGGSNRGAVVLVDGTVRRPARDNSEAVQRLLRHIRATGFLAVPEPYGFDSEGREKVSFIEGEVPRPPLPAWAATTGTIHAIGELIGAFREATASYVPQRKERWFASPGIPAEFTSHGRVGHNDIDFGNIIFKDRVPVGIIDFDYAAPSDPIWDIAVAAFYLVPLRDPASIDQRLAEQSPAERLAALTASAALPRGEASRLVDAVLAFHHHRRDRADQARRSTPAWMRQHDRDTTWLKGAATSLRGIVGGP